MNTNDVDTLSDDEAEIERGLQPAAEEDRRTDEVG